jgi:hypothetical protein
VTEGTRGSGKVHVRSDDSKDDGREGQVHVEQTTVVGRSECSSNDGTVDEGTSQMEYQSKGEETHPIADARAQTAPKAPW